MKILEKIATCKLRRQASEEQTLLIPSSQTESLQNCEKIDV